ncbi:MAG TPA: transposase [Pyrinomonadaceae bacterium]|jgi:REP element-mobilizing transposase RayT
MEETRPKGWYSRGYLPHFDGGQIPQFITARLFDALPQNILRRFQIELEHKDIENIEFEIRKQIEKFLDNGYGSCFLKDKNVGRMVADAILFHADKKYKLIAWVVMPNHIHFLVVPSENVELAEITHSIKSYTAKEANKFLKRTGKFWQAESFDRYVRNYEHYIKTIDYIENNPVKAGLCEDFRDWELSSAFRR